ncbi:fungal specific transcription factor domain-containing protein [Aspergillus stella-maris]|uniref:fungal specific transcription factor domain-containing protein n=1 Tax=Aspergillus stella-maris TaxID=1810926 RepID=UPI003CCE4F81
MTSQSGTDTVNKQPVKRYTRNSRACRRCRRLRTKCVNDGGQAPCEPCRQTNQECIFLRRGEPDLDREFRRPRTRPRQSIASTVSPTSPIQVASSHCATEFTENALPELLPPFEELFEGTHTFTTSFFQLGFIPKTLFFERLRKDPDSIGTFLLLGILSISARFTPSLVKRYGGASNATELFLSRAAALVPSQMYNPSLEATQGLFLMSIAEWGTGDKHRSSMHMGMAVTMAGILRLHREETYHLHKDATAEEFVHAEAARRTFWMLESYNSLLSGSSSPVSISYRDISALLPCSETEFAFGAMTGPRAAMAGTIPVLEDPSLAHCSTRSLFATLLQTHNLWGRVARAVSSDQQESIANEYTDLSNALDNFEHNVPLLHRWSSWNLRGFKAEGLDLAYYSAVMALRLCHIVLRRRYLHDRLQQNDLNVDLENNTTTELFQNMLLLHEQIDAFFEYRSPEQGFPALIVFCVYVCGSLANHLYQQPQICPSIAPHAESVLCKSLTGLGQLQDAWPLARKWNAALCNASAVPSPNEFSNEAQVEDQDLSTNARGGDLTMNGDWDRPISPPAFSVRLNDPFPTDVMLMEFEAYTWNDLFTSFS